MHVACMATKTISLKIEAWERLKRARRRPDESFSDVVMRAHWPEQGLTARELRAVYSAEGAHLSREALDAVQEATRGDAPPRDKWTDA
jgi:predicted CopG family antitoxin